MIQSRNVGDKTLLNFEYISRGNQIIKKDKQISNDEQKKSHIIAQVLYEYMLKQKEKKCIENTLSLIGTISKNLPNLQKIQASKENI